MATKTHKPTSPGRRGFVPGDRSDITADSPYPALSTGHARSGGRNNVGRTTTRFRGGGHKRRYRQIDFKRDKYGVVGRVATVEHDPNRSCRIALVVYEDGERRYILCPSGLKVGDTVVSSASADIKPGNSLPLSVIPVGTLVHNIELKIGAGGQIVRSAGGAAQLMAREGGWALLRLPSGEQRRVHTKCRATVGTVGNTTHANTKLGKAGRSRWLGRRPHNRGVAMNPVDHPMGGGEGRASGGHPRSPWGQPAKGYRTRRNKRTQTFIVARRAK